MAKDMPHAALPGVQLAKISGDWALKKKGRTSAKPGEPKFLNRHQDSWTDTRIYDLTPRKVPFQTKWYLSGVGSRVLVYTCLLLLYVSIV
jgi:hypothetical protein